MTDSSLIDLKALS